MWLEPLSWRPPCSQGIHPTLRGFRMPELDATLTRRSMLVMGVASVLHAGTVSAAEKPVVTVHRDPDCSCCGGWVQHLQKAAFRTNVLETRDLDAVKRKLGVPDDLRS